MPKKTFDVRIKSEVNYREFHILSEECRLSLYSPVIESGAYHWGDGACIQECVVADWLFEHFPKSRNSIKKAKITIEW